LSYKLATLQPEVVPEERCGDHGGMHVHPPLAVDVGQHQPVVHQPREGGATGQVTLAVHLGQEFQVLPVDQPLVLAHHPGDGPPGSRLVNPFAGGVVAGKANQTHQVAHDAATGHDQLAQRLWAVENRVHIHPPGDDLGEQVAQVDPALNRNNLDEFPLRNLDSFVGLLQRHRVRQIILTGTTTDPQLYRHEARLIRWLRGQLPEAQISLHTNGQLALKKIDVFNLYNRVSLSHPSFDPDTYQKMTGSRQVPDLAAIARAARVPVKVSCVINEHNVGQVDAFLARCHEMGIRRLVFRQLYGDPRRWDIPSGLTPVGTYRNNPMYDYGGMEVTYWNFGRTTSTSLNLFSDGSISSEYLLAKARSK